MKRIIFFAALVILICQGCSNTSVEYDKPFADGKLLVESYIVEGDTSISVRLEKPLSVYSGKGYGIDTSNRVHNAKVSVVIDGNLYKLEEYKGSYFSWYGVSMRNSSLYRIKQKISAFTNCSINVEHDNKIYSASAANPGKPEIVSAEAGISFLPNKFYYDLPLYVKVSLRYDNNKNNYYRVKAVLDVLMDGKESKEYYSYSYFCINEDTKNDLEFVMNSGHIPYHNNDQNSKFVLKKVILYIDKLSEDYYHVREILTAQHEDDDSPFGGEVLEIPSNISNGYGIFTCIARDSICAKVIE